ncbi:MAG: hypothetical protein LBO81_00945, partial [Clostridiales Family XIII bacterium]|jgi:hypothetical protein|nr:hypothetical protein [Clostridiales Family XIII bacterium]
VPGVTLTAQWTAVPASPPAPGGNPENPAAPGAGAGDDTVTTVRPNANASSGGNAGPDGTAELSVTGREIADPDVQAFAESGVPIVDMGPLQVPLHGMKDTLACGLLNLICCLIGLVFAVRGTVKYISGRRRLSAEDYGGAHVGKAKRNWVFAEVSVALLGVILFFLTQDPGGTIIVMDEWMPVSATLMGIVIVTNHFAFRREAKAFGSMTR